MNFNANMKNDEQLKFIVNADPNGIWTHYVSYYDIMLKL